MIEGYDGRKMSPLELELIFENRRIIIEEVNGTYLTVSKLCHNRLYPDFAEFSKSTTKKIHPEKAMPKALENLRANLQNGAALASTGESALTTLKLCKQIYALKQI